MTSPFLLTVFFSLAFAVSGKAWAWGPYECHDIRQKMNTALYAVELAHDDQIALLLKAPSIENIAKKNKELKEYDERKSDYFNLLTEAANWSTLHKNLCRKPASTSLINFDLYCQGKTTLVGKENVTLPWEDFVQIKKGRYKGRILEVTNNYLRHEHLLDDGVSVIYNLQINRVTGELHILDGTKSVHKTLVVTRANCEKVTEETRKF